MSNKLRMWILTTCLLSPVITCRAQGLEDEFFRLPLATRVERLRHYTLSDQYKIFRYGNDKKEPPLTDLAIPIAERGAEAIPFLLEQLKSDSGDMAVRDILLVLETMAKSKTYDVRSDASLMNVLNFRVSRMKDQEWKDICRSGVRRLMESE